jgi:hypothetical protein
MWKYVLAWIPMVAIAIANGALRESTYGKRVSELRAHQLSTASGALLLGVYMRVVMAIGRPESFEQALGIGGIWLFLTLAFEFLFGHYVAQAIPGADCFTTTICGPGGSGSPSPSGLRRLHVCSTI